MSKEGVKLKICRCIKILLFGTKCLEVVVVTPFALISTLKRYIPVYPLVYRVVSSSRPLGINFTLYRKKSSNKCSCSISKILDPNVMFKKMSFTAIIVKNTPFKIDFEKVLANWIMTSHKPTAVNVGTSFGINGALS